uniref:Uncharacterized protein n=1 Tax=Mola mola TaxID=94237 RepID=A0A3Q3XGN3_MOLML
MKNKTLFSDPDPPSETQRSPSLLPPAVQLCMCDPLSLSLSVSHPAGKKCPSLLHCTTEGRQHCRHGSSHCGPCLSPLVENEEGRCVGRKRHLHPEKVTFFPDPDEEIDFLQSIIAKQQVTEIQRPKSPGGLIAFPSNASFNVTQEFHFLTTFSFNRLMKFPSPFLFVISLCVVVGAVAVITSSVCYVKSQRESRLAQKVDYPAFGGAGVPAAPASSTSMGDKTLAQSAQMYHYQHRKQQIHAPDQNVPESEATSDEEEVGGDFTVYECPGLAPTGEMEVKNPLFDDSTLHYQGKHK